MVKTRKFVYSKKYSGLPKSNNFTIIEEELPPLKVDEILLESKYIGIDIVIRYQPISKLNIGDTIWAIQVVKVIESKNSKFPQGSHLVGYFPCSTYIISDGSFKNKYDIPAYMVDEKYHLSKYLGIFGTSMITAYYGVKEICKPKINDVFVVTSAAGGVGNMAGQIAKIFGCKVIGISSKSEKCLWLKGLGFDHVINYVTDDINEKLRMFAPEGVNCFFDNIGGELSLKIIEHMSVNGKIAICGSTSSYASDFIPKLPSIHAMVLTKQLSITGFLLKPNQKFWLETIEKAKNWFEEGKLKTRETIIEGFENYPNALTLTYNGDNLGKTIVKV